MASGVSSCHCCVLPVRRPAHCNAAESSVQWCVVVPGLTHADGDCACEPYRGLPYRKSSNTPGVMASCGVKGSSGSCSGNCTLPPGWTARRRWKQGVSKTDVLLLQRYACIVVAISRCTYSCSTKTYIRVHMCGNGLESQTNTRADSALASRWLGPTPSPKAQEHRFVTVVISHDHGASGRSAA